MDELKSKIFFYHHLKNIFSSNLSWIFKGNYWYYKNILFTINYRLHFQFHWNRGHTTRTSKTTNTTIIKYTLNTLHPTRNHFSSIFYRTRHPLIIILKFCWNRCARRTRFIIPRRFNTINCCYRNIVNCYWYCQNCLNIERTFS